MSDNLLATCEQPAAVGGKQYVAIAAGSALSVYALRQWVVFKVTVAVVRECEDPRAPGKTYTTTWFDMWRFVDGKADERWDFGTIAGQGNAPDCARVKGPGGAAPAGGTPPAGGRGQR